MNYVFDSSSLLYLGKLGLLGKVGNLDGKKFIPSNVYKEVVVKGFERGEPEAKYIDVLIKNKTFSISSAIFNRVKFLSDADTEVIELSKAKKSVAIIDETFAKCVAKSEGLECHGTLYIIFMLMKRKLITKNEAINYIDNMVRLGFYLSAEDYKAAMKFIEK